MATLADWINGHLATDECDSCRDRVTTGRRPFCAEICPTQALGLHDEEQILRLLRTGPRIQICKIGD
jgi:Fe-S-cluster-containing dehydrogenase component